MKKVLVISNPYSGKNAKFDCNDVMKEMFDTLKDDIIGVMLLGFADINATKKLIEPIENEEVLKTYVYYILTVYLYKYKKNVSF